MPQAAPDQPAGAPEFARTAPRSFTERVGALRNVPAFVALVWRTSALLMSLSLGLRLIRAVVPIATLYVGKLIIDDIVALAQLSGRPQTLGEWIESGLADRLIMLLAAEFGLAVLTDVLGRIVSLIDSLLSERVANISSVRLMEHAATLDLEDFEDASFQDRLERARRQTSGRMTLMSQLFGQVQDIVTVVSFGVGLVVYAPWLIVLLLIALVPAFLGEAHFNARSYSLDFGRTPERRELDYLRQTAASAETAKEVKIFGLNAFLIDRYRQLAADFYSANRALAMRRGAWAERSRDRNDRILSRLRLYRLAHAGRRFQHRRSDLSCRIFLAAAQPARSLLSSFSATASQALYLDDLFSFFEVEPEIHSPANPMPFPARIVQGFTFEDVGFIYPGAERWAVRHLSFTLRAGEVLALVGENGAGKTTLVKLLARLYDPDEGRILLDGHDLRTYDLDALRGHLGVIFQDFVRYNLSAGDNIAVGRIEARTDRQRIVLAAEESLANAVVARLPYGYDQMIGKRFKNGVELSGGEWQKIAIARAYMRDAQVLILDEPTAALDARAEFEVFQRFKELSAGRTAILISHRFSSVRMADRILVLADGKVEASGTHTELIAAGGRYAELFELQAAGYR